MKEARGLPIAAHLTLLVALAAGLAFVAALSVIVLLPPRPPDVLRSDEAAAVFAKGYAAALQSGRPPRGGDMRWRLAEDPPAPSGRGTPAIERQIAARLALARDAVRVYARVQRRDVFVFRVQPVGEGVIAGPPPHASPPMDAEEVETLRHLAEAMRDRAEPGHPPIPPPPPPPPEAPLFAPPPPGVLLVSGVEIGARLPDGRWLVMTQGRNWAELGWIARAALAVGLVLLVMTIAALLFARRLAQPIARFAEAVQAVGVDPRVDPVAETGPRELRGAARAVNAMQARLRALIADRTRTLAAVAHDMRTPLMRLRLAAENADPGLRERMAKEIGEVEALVASFIAFAREDPAEEPRVRLDLAALLDSLAADYAEAGHDVAYAGPDRAVVTGQALGLKRLFSNLIDNALRYGAAARIGLAVAGDAAVVDVDDPGPGISVAERARIFEPFVRLSDGAAGAGLGLAAARSIAAAHGGAIEALDAPVRGARFRVTLPQSAQRAA